MSDNAKMFITKAVKELNVKKLGRLRYIDDMCYLTYSGSEIGFYYDGGSLKATLYSDRMSIMPTLKACIAIMIEGDAEPYKRIALNPGEQVCDIYDRAEYAAWKKMSVEEVPDCVGIHMIKFSEAAFGTLGIKNLMVEENAAISPLPLKEHRIEYIGDSITCGYGVEGVLEKDEFTTSQENPQKSLSLKSAKRLDVDYQLVSWSGIGIITDYIPPEVDEPLTDVLIQEIYPYVDKKLDERLKNDPISWEFNQFVPEVVVLNIGTNDASYTREKEDREAWYAREMKKFIFEIHEKNPEAQIVFVYGVMDHTLCKTIEQLVDEIQKEGNEWIHYVELPEQLDSDGIGCDWHPNEITHEKCGKIVADYISQLMKW